MEVQSWNKELVLANAQFKRLFSNISIEKDGKRTKFQCVLGNRSRIFKHLENPEKNSMYKLPMIIIQRTGITKNNDRLANVNNEVKYATHSSRLDYNLYTPVPIDITYEVTIISKYQEHIDRAISNFIPFFNKDLYVRCQHPKFEGLFFTNQVVMEDGIQEEHPDEIDPSADDIVQATCTFTFKTYMFCGNKRAVATQKKIIQTRTEEKTYTEKFAGLSAYPYKLTEEDKKNIEKFLSLDLSVTLSQYVEMEVSNTVSEIVSVELSVDEISGFVPQINQLYVGFYPVPLLSQYIPHITWVDSLGRDVISVEGTTSAVWYPYVDAFTWEFQETSISDY
jgi:hypothetical protein